jgi:hypothetical protein
MRGHNAGGFTYMPMVACTKCGRRFKLGSRTIGTLAKRGLPVVCGNKAKCEERQQRIVATSGKEWPRGKSGASAPARAGEVA